MRCIQCFLIAAVCSIGSAFSARAESPVEVPVETPIKTPGKGEMSEEFVGKWRVVEGVSLGTPIPKAQLKGSVTVITRNRITTYNRSQMVTYSATYKLNTTTDPVQIDMTAINEGKRMKALRIVQFRSLDSGGGNEFSLAYSLEPGERPGDFESPVGSKIISMEMEEFEANE